MKKYILIFSALLSFDALADDTPPTSGSCAKANTDSTCMWSFDPSSGTLTISGTGQMEGYEPIDASLYWKAISTVYRNNRRIYTIDEANKEAGPVNRVSIRYR